NRIGTCRRCAALISRLVESNNKSLPLSLSLAASARPAEREEEFGTLCPRSKLPPIPPCPSFAADSDLGRRRRRNTGKAKIKVQLLFGACPARTAE
uniref:Uncharacterized protein n=1 Tax=Oryza nivara TaxID=4536 RepID=A0A0E0HTC8_ORYNI